jgi:hypothetical protein
MNRWELYPVLTLQLGTTDNATRSVTVSGTRDATSDTLIVLSFNVALGESDSVTIAVDSLTLEPCTTTIPSTSIGLRIAGICDAGGVKRFISTAGARLRAIITPNPINVNGGVAAVRATVQGDDNPAVTARVVDLLGHSTVLDRPKRIETGLQWEIPPSLPTGHYVFIVQHADTLATTAFEVVR